MRLTEQDIIKIVCGYYKLDYNAVVNSSCKKGELAEARQVSMYFIRKYFERISLRQIGELFKGRGLSGKKDHATIMYGIKIINQRIDLYIDFRKLITDIELVIKDEDDILGTVYGEDDCYYNDERDICVTIRRTMYFMRYKIRIPNPYLSMGPGIMVNGFSGFREHSL